MSKQTKLTYHQFLVKLPEKMDEDMRKCAIAKQMTMSQYIREAINTSVRKDLNEGIRY